MPSATATPGATPASLSPSFNAYRILSLPSPFASSSMPTTLSSSTIKAAYRRALLTHHPDKLPASAQSHSADPGSAVLLNRNNTSKNYTIDDVTLAYKTLLDPAARAAHDRSLRLNAKPGLAAGGDTGADEEGEEETQWQLGLEAVDLDDLAYDEGAEGGSRWWRGCRCGEEKGFVVDEEALEAAAATAGTGVGEVLVGCVGCSLWIRVGFAVTED